MWAELLIRVSVHRSRRIQALGAYTHMESFFYWVIRLRFLVIALVLACTTLAWIQVQSLRFEADADAYIPRDDPVMTYNDLVEERFGIRDLIIIGVFNRN